MPVSFGDFNKSNQDLFKGFCTKKSTTTFTAKSDNQTVKTELAKKSGSVAGYLKLTRNFDFSKFNFGLNVKATSGGGLEVEETLSKLPVEGVTLKFKNSEGVGCCDCISTQVEYADDNANCSLDFAKCNCTKSGHENHKINFAATFQYENFTFGGMFKASELKADEKKFSHSGGLGYSGDNYWLYAFGKDMKDITVGYNHTFEKKTNFGVELCHFKAEDKDDELTVGANHKIDDDNSFKGKYNSSGVLAFAYSTKFAKQVGGTVGINLDMNDSSKAANVGWGLDFKF